MVRRALALAALLPALAGCGRDGPEDPAIAAPGAGIPVGAVGASGVAFDAPTARPEATVAPKIKHGKPKVGIAPEDPTPDPFATPPQVEDPDVDPLPAPGLKPKPKPHSPSETTL